MESTNSNILRNLIANLSDECKIRVPDLGIVTSIEVGVLRRSLSSVGLEHNVDNVGVVRSTRTENTSVDSYQRYQHQQ